jgi:hypothetical protein
MSTRAMARLALAATISFGSVSIASISIATAQDDLGSTDDSVDPALVEPRVDDPVVVDSSTTTTTTTTTSRATPGAGDAATAAAPATGASASSPTASGNPGGAIFDTTGWDFRVDPTLVVVGGAHAQFIVPRDDADMREDRFTIVALSRVGLRARIGPYLTLESEVEVSAGPHGTSVWEGQASFQIRNQLVRIDWESLRIEAGRITDPSSLDYHSAYIANMLLTDPLARYPLLVSGFNRGNGVAVRYRIADVVHVGATVNAGNPTSTTGTVMIGGTFPPFARFYEVPWSHVGRDARGFPLDSMQVVLVSPHVTLDTDVIRAQASMQFFVANTDTNSFDDENLTGYNIRLGLRGILFGGMFQPFANFSRILNDTVEATDLGTLAQADYEALTVSGGFDFAIHGASGIGAQYVLVREQVDGGVEQVRHFFNAGGSAVLFPFLSVDARYGMMMQCDDGNCGVDQEHSVWLTLRGTIGNGAQISGRP